jgi:hypothetical protein
VLRPPLTTKPALDSIQGHEGTKKPETRGFLPHRRAPDVDWDDPVLEAEPQVESKAELIDLCELPVDAVSQEPVLPGLAAQEALAGDPVPSLRRHGVLHTDRRSRPSS